jgi:hypothetical protein
VTRTLVFVICVLGTACVVGGGPPPDTAVRWLKTRAGTDFHCPSSQVKTATIDDHTKVATGCGWSAKYVLVCDECLDGLLSAALSGPVLEECDCAWKLASRVESQASR